MADFKDIIIPSGKIFTAKIHIMEGASFSDTRYNEYDGGGRTARFGEFQILKVIDRSQETVGSSATKTINGFLVKNGTIVSIQLIKDVANNIQISSIVYSSRPNNEDKTSESFMKGYYKAINNAYKTNEIMNGTVAPKFSVLKGQFIKPIKKVNGTFITQSGLSLKVSDFKYYAPFLIVRKKIVK